MSIPISQLPAATEAGESDLVALVRNGVTRRCATTVIKDYVLNEQSGGTSGQILSKASGTDFDTQWINPPCKTVYNEGVNYIDFGSVILFFGICNMSMSGAGGGTISIPLPVTVERVISGVASPTSNMDYIMGSGFVGYGSTTTTASLYFYTTNTNGSTYYFGYQLLCKKAV